MDKEDLLDMVTIEYWRIHGKSLDDLSYMAPELVRSGVRSTQLLALIRVIAPMLKLDDD